MPLAHVWRRGVSVENLNGALEEPVQMWRRVRHLPQFLHILPRRTRRGGRLGRHLELFGSVHRSIVVPGNKPSPITLPTLFIASRWLGYVRLGLALSMIAACRGFSAIPCYSIPTATAIVAIPAMRRYKYDDVFSVGTGAATGNIGILIPPAPRPSGSSGRGEYGKAAHGRDHPKHLFCVGFGALVLDQFVYNAGEPQDFPSVVSGLGIGS